MNFFLNGDNETHNSSDFIKKLKKKLIMIKSFTLSVHPQDLLGH